MNKRLHILLVEDNQGDVLLMTETLEESKLIERISVVSDGEEALNFVFRTKEYENENTPDLILLDFNLPKISGLDVLKSLKSDELIKRIPVIMLTTSSDSNDIRLSYSNHVNCFLTKPSDAFELQRLVKSIEDFWLDKVSFSSIS